MKQSRAATAVKYTFKALGLILVFGTIAILLWRVFTAGNPKDMENLSINDTLVEAWNEAEADGRDLTIYTPVMPDGSQITSVLGKNYSYFAVTHNVFIEEAHQVQVLFRYNNSTLKHTAEDYSLPSIPSRDEEVYDVTLLFAIDLTPDDKEDNLGNDEGSVNFIRCHGEVTLTAQKNLYNFRRIVFELDDAEINISELLDSELLLAIYADFYYNGAIDYEAEPYGTLCIYDFKSANIPVKLEKHDVKAIQAFEDN